MLEKLERERHMTVLDAWVCLGKASCGDAGHGAKKERGCTMSFIVSKHNDKEHKDGKDREKDSR